jgi:hypothetical protein
MLFRGGFSYKQEKGIRLSVDYGIPSTHKLQLVGNDVWGTGSTRNPVEDIFDMKKILSDDAGVAPEYTVTTTEVATCLLILLRFWLPCLVLVKFVFMMPSMKFALSCLLLLPQRIRLLLKIRLIWKLVELCALLICPRIVLGKI